MENRAILIDKEVPYIVKSVKDCLQIPGAGFEFPEPVGDNYKTLKFSNGISWVVEYLPIFGGFDIETTNVNEEHNQRAYMYHAQMSVFSWEKGVVYTARTWDEIHELFEAFVRFYKISPTLRAVQWIANASFEHQFLRKRFTWSQKPFDFFAKESRQPLLFTLDPGLEFRECLSISGGGLAQLCSDYCHTQKLKGDLDFSIMRNSKTPLTEKELNYCINDVVPLAEWSAYIFENFVKGGGKIPLTKTGILRTEVKQAARAILKGRASDYRQLLRMAHPKEDEYNIWRKYLFRGGYVHSNVAHTGKKLKNVQMWDITSSYPARMNLSPMPSRFVVMPKKYQTEEWLDKIAQDPDKSFVIQVTFTELKSRFNHSIESTSKAEFVEYYTHKVGDRIEIDGIDNGRISYCHELTVWLTDYDWLIYRMFYEWEGEAVVGCAKWADNMWLPPYLLDTLNKHYKKKAQLKKAGMSGSPIYAIEKSGVNAFFGLTVTSITLTGWEYLDDWLETDGTKNFEDEVQNCILLPQWGIWIAASARYSLLKLVYDIEEACKDDYPNGIVIYNDTDSCKLFKDDRATAIIEKYNAGIAEQLKERGLTDPEFSDLGMYDFEGEAKYFCTLGAKRYLATVKNKKGEWETVATVAGLPKVAISEMEGDPYEEFQVEGMLIPKEKSHKKTHAWRDQPHDDIIDGELMHEESSVAIYDIKFTLNLDDAYKDLIGSYLNEGNY